MTNSEFYKQYLESLTIEAFGSDGFLMVNKRLLKKLGIIPAILLSQYIDSYKLAKRKNTLIDGWFVLPHTEVSDILNIGERTIRRNKSILKDDLQIIKTKMQGVPAQEYLKINFVNLLENIGFLGKTNGMEEEKPQTNDNSPAWPNLIGLEWPNSVGLYIRNKETKENIKEKFSAKTISLNFLNSFPNKFKENEDFQNSLLDYFSDRKERKKTLTSRGMEMLKNKLIQYDVQICIEALNTSIEQGWTGVFPENIIQRKTKEKKEKVPFPLPFGQPREKYPNGTGIRYTWDEQTGCYRHKNGDKLVE